MNMRPIYLIRSERETDRLSIKRERERESEREREGKRGGGEEE